MAATEQGSPLRDEAESQSDEDGSLQPPAGDEEHYDPNIDDVDEKWADKQRRGHESDAVLSCPACFTSLCLDCQRHEKYTNQFRAVFVRNCRVVEGEILRVSPHAAKQAPKTSRRKSGKSADQGEPASGGEAEPSAEVYKPVQCAECGTQVGVLDAEEVYHFYDVIPSYS